MPFLLTIALLFLAFVPSAEAADETPGATFAASLTAAGQFADAGTAQSVSISDDGRFLAFVSASGNLDPDAPAGVAEAYVKDLDTGAISLVSRADGTEGEPAEAAPPGQQPQTGIERALISGDGRYVLFTSRATNLAEELPLPLEEAEEFFSTHVYRRDLATGETVLVDRETGLDGPTHLLEASGMEISADGRLVVFRADAPDLGDPSGEHESTGSGTIYVRDISAGTTTAVSRASGEEGELANARSSGGAISPDADRVAFDTFATNPGLGGEDNVATQVYMRDLGSPFETTLLSRSNPTGSAPAGEQANGESFEPVFAGSGCRVGFTSEATNLVAAGGSAFQAYLRDECSATPSTELVGLDPEGAPFAEAALLDASGDGRLVLLSGESSPLPRHLYVRDLAAGQTALVDRASGEGAPADRAVEQGALSANGCRVAFTSAATNLTAEAPPGGGSSDPLQVYVRQLAPCRATDEPPRGAALPPGGGGGGTGAMRLAILALRPPLLRLGFSAAGTATVRLARRVGPDGRQRWRRVAAFVVSATGPGEVGATLPRLAPGRYRLRIRLQAPAGGLLRRVFTVPAR